LSVPSPAADTTRAPRLATGARSLRPLPRHARDGGNRCSPIRRSPALRSRRSGGDLSSASSQRFLDGVSSNWYSPAARRGIIAADRWADPYMSSEHLQHETAGRR
jgi:hypothetical protein